MRLAGARGPTPSPRAPPAGLAEKDGEIMATAIGDLLLWHRKIYLPRRYNDLAEQLIPTAPSEMALAAIVFQRTTLPPHDFIALPLEHKIFYMEQAVQAPITDTAFQPASRVCSVFQSVFPSLAKLDAYLGKHSEIREAKPQRQRRVVHVGDLMEALAKEGKLGTDPLESPRELDAMAGAMERKQKIDQKYGR